MKVRRDFVTNSSSSSFIISKKYLDVDQIEAIRKHSLLGEKFGMECTNEPWNLSENEDYITGSTWMDNFDMGDFLERIDICERCITWGEYPFTLPGEGMNEDIDEDSDWRKLLHEI